MELPKFILMKKIKEYLEEDIGYGDITTNALIKGSGPNKKAQILTREEGIVAGTEEISILFDFLNVKNISKKNDGDEIQKNDVIIELEGPVKGILGGERTALNLLMRMSGIATATRKLVEQVQRINPAIRVACTRKTTPGFRYFEKKAVSVGMGDTHRFRLDDMILIKDNHLKLIPNIPKVIELVKQNVGFSKRVEIEVASAEQALVAAKAKVDIIMLDNFSIAEIQRTLELLKQNNLRNQVILEISGNITPENILNYVKLDIDVISLGYLTHSVKSLDLTLEIL